MNAQILEYSGFCKGVEKAINKLDEVIKENKNKTIYLLGEIVHNDVVTKKYNELGVKIISIDDLNNLEKDSIIVSSAHGISDNLRNKLKSFNHIDTTCPFVRANQEKIKSIHNKEIIFIGKKGHQESIAMTDGINNLLFVETTDDLKSSLNEGVVYNQTTLNEDKLEIIHKEIMNKYPNYIINNTLCETTKRIQNFLKSKDNSFDTLIVVGSKQSSNANSLVSLSKYEKTFFINSKDELKFLDLKTSKSVIIIGSASTPKELLKEIKDKLLMNY